jgi:hypothetical protein
MSTQCPRSLKAIACCTRFDGSATYECVNAEGTELLMLCPDRPPFSHMIVRWAHTAPVDDLGANSRARCAGCGT